MIPIDCYVLRLHHLLAAYDVAGTVITRYRFTYFVNEALIERESGFYAVMEIRDRLRGRRLRDEIQPMVTESAEADSVTMGQITQPLRGWEVASEPCVISTWLESSFGTMRHFSEVGKSLRNHASFLRGWEAASKSYVISTWLESSFGTMRHFYVVGKPWDR